MDAGQRGPGTAATKRGLRASKAWCVLCLLAAAAFPLELDAQQWSVGLRVGASATRMNFDDPAASEAVLAAPGFHVGALVERSFATRFALRVEALVNRKGFDSDVDEKLTFTYLELPLLLSAEWSVPASPRLFAGPVLGFELGCHSTRVLGLGELACDDPASTLLRKKTDLGIAIGAGVGFRAAGGAFGLDLWLEHGMRDVSLETRPPGGVRHQALMLSAIYVRELRRSP